MRKAISLFALAILVFACNGETKRQQERLAALERQRTDLQQRLTARRNAMHESQQRLDALNGTLATHNTELHAFIEEHRIAVECIRTSRSAWGEGNTTLSQGSGLTKVGAAMCAVGLLSSDFAREVATVSEKLREADAHVQNVKGEIAAAQRVLDEKRSEVEGSQAAIDRIDVEIADLQRQMKR